MKSKWLIIMALSRAAVCAQAQELDHTRDVLSQWVETRKVISEEKQKWELEREMLSDRIDLVRTERDTLTETIHKTQADITDADRKREDLIQENDSLKNASATLGNRIYMLEREILKLLPSLPPPVLEKIRTTTQSIPTTEETELSLSIRYQNILYILNQLNKSAVEIAEPVSEVREMGDGSQVEGLTLYIGFACAYWCSSDGAHAQVGHPTADGWKWEANDAIASRVAHAVSVLKGEKVAEFISLPVSVDQQ